MRFSKPTTEFTIRVASKNTRHPKKWDALDSFFDAKVEVLLDRFDKPTILIGLPGAGKSYSLRKSAADQAEKLHTTCLREKPDAADLVVPIFADLKLYQGNLETLITASLPAGLDFHDLLDKFTVRIYLDSFNEMPRKFVESGECKSDLGRFLQTIGTSPIVIGSRTLDGLEGLRFASYEIDAIEESTVDEELRKRGFSLGGRFQVEMKALLQRPFFFRYILDGEITLPAEPHPKEFYRLILNRAGQKLATKLLRPLDLVKILRPVAYQALNSGEEAFPLTRLLRAIEANAPGSAADGTSASDIANGLVAHSILIPYSGERIAFVHQSITEYLASFELAERFGATPELLREKLSLRRWDQALFLALSHLKPPLDHQFFHAVLNIDLGLAIASAKFVEVGRDQLVSELLDELIRRGDSIDRHDFFQVESAMINSFPVNESHLPKLTQLLRSAHPLRGTAFRYVVGIRGRAVKNEYLRLLVEFRGDYNFCANVVGPTLAQFATDEDLATLAQWSRELEIGLKDGEFEEKEYHGFVFGGAAFAARLSFASVRQYLLPLSREELVASPLRTELIRNIALDLKTTDALKCACDLLLLGDIKVSFIIHLILAHSDSEGHLNVNLLAISHIEALLTIFCNTNSEYNMWAGGAIDDVCKCRPDLRPMVESRAAEMSGIQRAHLLMCVRQDQAPLFVALEALLLVSNDELRAADSTSIYHSNLNWKGKETLLLSLLARKDPRLCRGLIGIGIPVDLKGFGKVEILNSTWWLEWLAECLDVNDHWLVGTLSSFLGKYATKSLTHRMVTAFNDPTSEHRSLILSHVLPFFDSVSTEDLSDEGVLFAIDHLLREEISIFGGTFLGGTATESFVNEKILPLLSRVGEAEVLRVRQALDEAGQRHGRRYF
jgi:hypothetical protein